MLKKLRGDVGVEDLSADPGKTLAAIDKRYSMSSSRVALTALRHEYPDNKTFQEEMIKRRMTWRGIDMAQEPTERQLKKFIPWDDILTFRDQYYDGMTTTEQMLISLYTIIPPARADYTPMKIVSRRPKKPEDGTNYLVLGKSGGHFLFHAFKTHKTMGDQYVKIPPKLVKVIRASIVPTQTYLLESNGEAWSEARLGAAVRSIFQKYLDMDTGISMMRHSYTTKVHAGEKSIKENQKIATSMLHSVGMSQAYRFLSLE